MLETLPSGTALLDHSILNIYIGFNIDILYYIQYLLQYFRYWFGYCHYRLAVLNSASRRRDEPLWNDYNVDECVVNWPSSYDRTLTRVDCDT